MEVGYSDGVIVNEENTLEVLYYRSGLMKAYAVS